MKKLVIKEEDVMNNYRSHPQYLSKNLQERFGLPVGALATVVELSGSGQWNPEYVYYVTVHD